MEALTNFVMDPTGQILLLFSGGRSVCLFLQFQFLECARPRKGEHVADLEILKLGQIRIQNGTGAPGLPGGKVKFGEDVIGRDILP
jgi:hypothetical protein